MLALLLICIGIFFVNLDAIGINIMEARNFTTAREMVDDGNWVLTTLNGEPRYQKPPLPTWLTALSGMVFGFEQLSWLRLPAAMMALMLVLFAYRMGRLVVEDRKYALLVASIMASSFYIIFSGRNGQWDIYTHAFMLGCIYLLWQFFEGSKGSYRLAVLAAILFGASFMSKGPVSLYALLLPFLIAYGIVYRYNNFKTKWGPLLVFLLLALPLSGWWHLYTYLFDAEAVAAITRKETANWTGYNIRPFYYYWSFFTQSGIWTLPAFVGLLYPYLKTRVCDLKAYRFSLIWTLAAVVLLSVIPEKKSRYLLPVLIPLAFNTAFYIEYLIRQFSKLTDKRETFPVYLQFGLIGLIGLAVPVGGFLFLQDGYEVNWVLFGLLSICMVLIGLYTLKNLRHKKMDRVFGASIVFIMAIMCFGIPLSKSFVHNPEYKDLSELRQFEEKEGIISYEFGGFMPEMVWTYGKPIPRITDDFGNVSIPQGNRYGVLVSEDNDSLFKASFHNYRIQHLTRYDQNQQAPGTRTHRPRLWREYYLVEKD